MSRLILPGGSRVEASNCLPPTPNKEALAMDGFTHIQRFPAAKAMPGRALRALEDGSPGIEHTIPKSAIPAMARETSELRSVFPAGPKGADP